MASRDLKRRRTASKDDDDSTVHPWRLLLDRFDSNTASVNFARHWMVDMMTAAKADVESVHLALILLHVYLAGQTTPIAQHNNKLVAGTAAYIAIKFLQDEDHLTVKQLTRTTSVYSAEQFRAVESDMLTSLDYRLSYPSLTLPLKAKTTTHDEYRTALYFAELALTEGCMSLTVDQLTTVCVAAVSKLKREQEDDTVALTAFDEALIKCLQRPTDTELTAVRVRYADVANHPHLVSYRVQ